MRFLEPVLQWLELIHIKVFEFDELFLADFLINTFFMDLSNTKVGENSN